MSYKERELTVEFTLANGTFDGKKGNTLIAENSSASFLFRLMGRYRDDDGA
jgi:hypothetical protein